MNLMDAYVTEIKGEPFFEYGKWFVPVKADCEGLPLETDLMFDTEAEVRAVKVGDHFLA